MKWVLAVAAVAAFGQGTLPEGERLYRNYCAHCHGATGEGARAPALAQMNLPRASDDATFLRVVQGGIPDTEMPPSRLTEAEVRQIRAYLQDSATRRPVGSSGDSVRGEALFRGKGGCLQCHMVGGQGGRMGPELTSIGLRRGGSRLRTAILDPEAEVPDNFAQYRQVIPMPDNFVLVRVRTRDGREIRGIRMNEDPFSIQLRDLDDKLHSFLKPELAELVRESGKSPMPGYRGKLEDREVEDLVAYLLSLRREP